MSEAAADAVVSDAGRVARLVNAVYYSLDPQVAEWFVTLLMGVVGGRPGVPGERVAARCLRVIDGGQAVDGRTPVDGLAVAFSDRPESRLRAMIAAVLTSLPLRLVPLNEHITQVQESSATSAEDERRFVAVGRSPAALRVIVAATAIGDDDVEGLCGNATRAIADLVFGKSAAAQDRAAAVAATPGAVDALFSALERYACTLALCIRL